jgi:hypothetical protein
MNPVAAPVVIPCPQAQAPVERPMSVVRPQPRTRGRVVSRITLTVYRDASGAVFSEKTP